MKKILSLYLLITLVFVGCNSVEPINTSSVDDSFSQTSSNVLQNKEVYEDILIDYDKLVDYRLNAWDSDEEYVLGETLMDAFDNQSSNDIQWSSMFGEMPNAVRNMSKNSFGYLFLDLNNDDIPELFWVREDSFILAVFTFRDGNIVCLDTFWSRYKCIITDSNELFCYSYDGDDKWYYIYVLSANNELTCVKEFGINCIYDEAKNEYRDLYYETVDEEKVYVNKERYEELLNGIDIKFGTHNYYEENKGLPITFLE